ncbi:MAG: hypothetical protein LBD30_04300 [Verrucomicrobiales bacterium]|jgi:hypothetical protein|nr:hypothetical protein [Verrucomicrobiales bacterium]
MNTRHFILGTISGVIVTAAVIWFCQYSAADRAVTEQHPNLPLIASVAAASVADSASPAKPEPVDQSADCAKLIADLLALQTQTDAHLNALRAGMTTAYLATRSSEIDLDTLTVSANTVKQDLATFQQTYAQIDPLINAFTPAQIDQLGKIKEQFAGYQRLSDRLDNTLGGITEHRERLAASEAGAAAPNHTTFSGSAGGDVTVSSTTTQTVTTITSQPGSVYTESVYYYTTTPIISFRFGSGYYDPFWRASYWPRHHYNRPPPRPPVAPPHRPNQPPPAPNFKPAPNNPPRPAIPNRPAPPPTRPNIPPPANNRPMPFNPPPANSRPAPPQRPSNPPQQFPVQRPAFQPQRQNPPPQQPPPANRGGGFRPR